MRDTSSSKASESEKLLSCKSEQKVYFFDQSTIIIIPSYNIKSCKVHLRSNMKNNKAEINDKHRKQNASSLNFEYKAIIC